ncbi:hypothetical protein F5Y16DRAFT_359229 [Xylariaceae sp. FL0255]|nr:hypothetical protein F5Y16DRAFT_359229 [Xylariaceae sp. FL0255]
MRAPTLVNGYQNYKRPLARDEREENAHLPSPKRPRTYSLRPLFDKKPMCSEETTSIDRMRNRHTFRPTSPSSVAKSPFIDNIKRSYTLLRAGIHSDATTKLDDEQTALISDAEKQIETKRQKRSEIIHAAQDLRKSVFEVRVDLNITTPDGNTKKSSVSAKETISYYQEDNKARTEQLAQLLKSWEETQREIDELSTALKERHTHETGSSGTNGMHSSSSSPHLAWLEQEYADLRAGGEQVVKELAACEDEFQEELENEVASVTEAWLKR